VEVIGTLPLFVRDHVTIPRLYVVILKKSKRMRKETTGPDPDLCRSQVRVNRSGGLRNTQVRSGLRSGVPKNAGQVQVSGQGVPET
jgi:hypothetical protein